MLLPLLDTARFPLPRMFPRGPPVLPMLVGPAFCSCIFAVPSRGSVGLSSVQWHEDGLYRLGYPLLKRIHSSQGVMAASVPTIQLYLVVRETVSAG